MRRPRPLEIPEGFLRVCVLACRRRRAPSRADRHGTATVQKAAPSFGRIALMVGFALSCFGLLLFLWLAFGGPVPLKPKGYRVNASFAQASQLATEADVRISGVPVGKVKAIEPDAETGRADVTMELQSRYAPLPSDARAILRQKTLLGETYVELTPGSAKRRSSRRAAGCPRAPVSRHGRAGRDPAHLRPATRAGVPAAGRRPRRRRSPAAGATSTTRSATSGRSRTTPPSSSTCSTARSRRCGAGLQHRGRVRRAVRARRPAARADREREPGVRDDRVARPRAAGDVRGAADLRARVARDDRPADGVRATTPTRWSPSCGPPRASCRRRSKTCPTWRRSSNRCSAASAR